MDPGGIWPPPTYTQLCNAHGRELVTSAWHLWKVDTRSCFNFWHNRVSILNRWSGQFIQRECQRCASWENENEKSLVSRHAQTTAINAGANELFPVGSGSSWMSTWRRISLILLNTIITCSLLYVFSELVFNRVIVIPFPAI